MKIVKLQPLSNMVGLFVVLFLCFFLTCCGHDDSSEEDSNNGDITFTAVWRTNNANVNAQRNTLKKEWLCHEDGYNIKKIIAIIKDASEKELARIEPECYERKGTFIDIPSGQDRYIFIQGFVNNEPVWEGESERFTIRTGQTTPIGVVELTYKGPDEEQPYIISRYPENIDSPVDLNVTISAWLNEPLVNATANHTNCRLLTLNDQIIECDVHYDEPTSKVTLKPKATLLPDAEYRVVIENLEDRTGHLLKEPQAEWWFKTLSIDWAMVSAGENHTVGIRTDGTLWAWGRNLSGQLGIGKSAVEIHKPKRVGSDTGWVSISAGDYHTMAIKNDGTLWAWGLDYNGQLGIDGSIDGIQYTPKRIEGHTGWIAVSAGTDHTLAIKGEEDTGEPTLWAWGDNTYGQLGIGESINSNQYTPKRIEGHTGWVAISAGGRHTVAIKENGTLWVWGDNRFGNLGIDDLEIVTSPRSIEIREINDEIKKDWDFVAAGFRHTFAIDKNGVLYAWGNEGITRPEKFDTSSVWKFVSTGRTHTVAVKTDDSICAWGMNHFGQLGTGDTENKLTPAPIGDKKKWNTVVAGGSHTVALNGSKLYAWGYNGFGQVGIGISEKGYITPEAIETENRWTAVAAGMIHTLAIRRDGTLWSWGRNSEGQLGDNTTFARQTPKQVKEPEFWKDIAAGAYHSVAISNDNTLWAWGSNFYGELGIGSSEWHINEPTPIGSGSNPIGLDPKWIAVSAGEFYAAAIKRNELTSSLFTWGANYHGQLGDNKLEPQRDLPYQVGNENDWAFLLATGAYHTIAEDVAGNVCAWGGNDYGQLGFETIEEYYPSPDRKVLSSPRWRKLAAGVGHSLAIKGNGHLYAWGDNSYGQLGVKGVDKIEMPEDVDQGSWRGVIAGAYHTFAIEEETGKLYAWGFNGYGQLGDGSWENRWTKVPIADKSKWLAVAAGDTHTVAIREDGTLWSWGSNEYGQLGNGKAWILLPTEIK